MLYLRLSFRDIIERDRDDQYTTYERQIIFMIRRSFRKTNETIPDSNSFATKRVSNNAHENVLQSRNFCYVSMYPLHVSTQCLHSMSPFHVSTQCLYSMYPLNVSIQTLHPMYPLNVSTHCLHSMSTLAK